MKATQPPLWNIEVIKKIEPYSFWVWLDNIGVGIIPLLRISGNCTVAEVEGVADGVHVGNEISDGVMESEKLRNKDLKEFKEFKELINNKRLK